jgi:hypothetical protein
VPDKPTVKEVLSRLAVRPPGRGSRIPPGGEGYRPIIDRAGSATDSLEAASTFIDEVGTDRLAAAVDAAEAAGDHAAARRGWEALDAFARVGSAAETTDADHFHSNQGTALGGGTERAGK